ncbi:MAG: YccF domain-containing protein, partial [Candidatus Omnitrophica bacterium]|nr:YccF domain-containing protein [Candidatus Omnitrophota bacterium]
LLGLILTATVIAAPIGLGLMELGKFLFLPFGRAMVNKSEINVEQNKVWKAYSTIIMILYIPVGILLSLLAVLQVAGLFVSIIGIPAAIVVAKSLGTFFNPVNKKCVHQAVADELEKRKAQAEISKHISA